MMGVHFPAGSFAYLDQVRAGLIDAERAGESLAVWPVQLWESAGCLVLAVVLWRIFERVRRGRRVSGEAFLALGIGYCGVAVLAWSLPGRTIRQSWDLVDGAGSHFRKWGR